MVSMRRRRKAKFPKEFHPPQKMKIVRVDHNTQIEVSADISDEDAIERFNLRRRVGPNATGMALIALKEAEKEKIVVVPPIDLEIPPDEEEEE